MLECWGFVPHRAQFNIKEVILTTGPPATQKQAGKPSTQLGCAVAPCFQDSRAYPSLSRGLGGGRKCFLVGVAVERVERLCWRNKLLVS